MERSHLDQMISELSEKRHPDSKVQEIMEAFNSQRIEKYLSIARAINQAQIDLEEEEFEEKFDLLIEASRDEFGDALKILELEKRIDLSYEYNQQVRLLEKIGILQTLPDSGKPGITGIDGQEYPIPTITEIAKSVTQEKGDLLVNKIEQGFNVLIIVPFALPLEKFYVVYGKILRDLARENNLFSSDEIKLNIDQGNPIKIGPSYVSHENQLVYYPSDLSKSNNGGKTKQEILNEGSGWEIKLIEDYKKIPQDGDGLSFNGREVLTTNKYPSDYLNLIQSRVQYSGEKGFTIEDWLTLAINRLQMDRFQIDVKGQDPNCLNFGTFLPWLNSVSVAEYRSGQACLEFNNNNRSERMGTRTSVQIN